ncbi:hypothetical protein [Aquibium sp. ELW1220]|uniref:hypothetical protein n=1 Tax=Aquibium sp. ELW1220 TaxID=2976766 RepID=UPI0025B1D9CA|nr:hypothetical protein [Aquibium sp. ELW1220]MDN2578737.1 hypothetical protein [Aquibium sp. ELW1220]
MSEQAVRHSLKVAALSPAAKEAARKLDLDGNQKALLQAAKQAEPADALMQGREDYAGDHPRDAHFDVLPNSVSAIGTSYGYQMNRTGFVAPRSR